MKINIGKKAIAKGLLSFIGIQALTVALGVCHRYIFPAIKPPLKEESKTVSDFQSDILYRALVSFHNPIEPMQDERRVFSISFVGTTSATTLTSSIGPSGDIAAMDSTMDFIV